MVVRRLLALNSTSAFHEELSPTDTTSFGGLTISPGNIDMSTTGKVTGLAPATTNGDALAYGQATARLASLTMTGAIAMSGNQFTGMGNTILPQDATTKYYVDVLGGQVKGTYITVDGLAPGDPVAWSTTNSRVYRALSSADPKARVIGLNSNAPVLGSAPASIVSQGPLLGVLSGATAGSLYFLQPSGGIGTSVPGSGNRIIEVGVAMNATDLWVQLKDCGKKP